MQNNKKLGINSVEHISFLNEKNQIRIAEIIQNYNYEITDSIAQKIKRDFRKNKTNPLTKTMRYVRIKNANNEYVLDYKKNKKAKIRKY